MLVDQYDTRNNLGYFIPFWRLTNNSHCTAIPGFDENPPAALFTNFAELVWDGSEIQAEDMNVHDYAIHLLDNDTPLRSYFEEELEGPFVPCTPGNFNMMACQDAMDEFQ